MKIAYQITSGKMKIDGFLPLAANIDPAAAARAATMRDPMFCLQVARAAFKAHGKSNPGLYKIKTAIVPDAATVAFPKRVPLSKLL